MTFLENTKKGRPRIEYALTLDKVFSTWIRDRIAQYEFAENKDYISFHRKMERVVGGTNLLKIKTLLSSTKNGAFKERYEFVGNQDFVTFSENSEKGRPRLEYALTLGKTFLTGLRTVLSGTNLWKTKIISRFTKNETRGWWHGAH